jgi:hypothetical protein
MIPKVLTLGILKNKSMKQFVIFILLNLFSINIYAQNLTISNQKSIGGNGEDVLPFTIKSPTNDGYFMIGNSTSGISGDKTDTNRGFSDIWLVKTDLDFNVLWDKTYGGDGIDQSYGAIIENNKIYIFATSTSSISGEKTTQIFGAPEFADLWLLCLDLTGNIINYNVTQVFDNSSIINNSVRFNVSYNLNFTGYNITGLTPQSLTLNISDLGIYENVTSNVARATIFNNSLIYSSDVYDSVHDYLIGKAIFVKKLTIKLSEN